MQVIDVNSSPSFKFVGGRLCLDFVNTTGGWISSGPDRGRDYCDTVLRDKWKCSPDLLQWAKLAGILVGKTAMPDQAEAVLARARMLRRVIYRLLRSTAQSWSPWPADLAALNREVAAARSHEAIAFAHGSYRWMSRAAPSDPESVLWPVVRDAAELLCSNDLRRVIQCSGTDCGWFFLDTSRNRSRRWCDMSDCGNRAKAARFRERRR